MAGSEKIAEKILDQAREQVKTLEEDARSRAGAEGAQLVEQAKVQAEALLERSKADMAEQERRILAVADLELRKRVLAAKREVLEEAFADATAKLNELDDEKYVNAYVKLVLPAIQKGTEAIAPSETQKERLGQAFVNRLNSELGSQGKTAAVTLLEARNDIDGGCIVVDGGMEIDFSHNAVMRNLRESTEAEVSHLLFGNGEG